MPAEHKKSSLGNARFLRSGGKANYHNFISSPARYRGEIKCSSSYLLEDSKIAISSNVGLSTYASDNWILVIFETFGHSGDQT